MENNKITKFNLAKNISDHMLGENHSLHHRLLIGGGIMVVGVLVSHYGGHFSSNPFVIIASDLVGYAIHDIGGIPIFEQIIKARSV